MAAFAFPTMTVGFNALGNLLVYCRQFSDHLKPIHAARRQVFGEVKP
jgi:hypothetical protein